MNCEVYLYHYSEDPTIKLFEPRPSVHAEGPTAGKQLVWAIDERHSPVYYFPRNCPRVMLWPVEGSTQADIDLWMNSDARMVAHIESAWADRFAACVLYRYTFDGADFENLHDHGVHVNPAPVEPIAVEPVGDLGSALEAENVELRAVESLQPLADAWFSTLHFSGVRLKNAQEWTPPVGERPL